ncbi:hypothetical protein GCM10010486_51730 [Nonomuraea roseoviolacea subsp. carminata]
MPPSWRGVSGQDAFEATDTSGHDMFDAEPASGQPFDPEPASGHALEGEVPPDGGTGSGHGLEGDVPPDGGTGSGHAEEGPASGQDCCECWEPWEGCDDRPADEPRRADEG